MNQQKVLFSKMYVKEHIKSAKFACQITDLISENRLDKNKKKKNVKKRS